MNFYRPRSEASEGYVFTGVCPLTLSNWGGGAVTPNASWDRSDGGGGGLVLVGGGQRSTPPGNAIDLTTPLKERSLT